MPRIEVEEADYNALQGVNSRMAQALKHPEARKLLLRAIKTADPSAPIPEIDAAAPIDAAVTEVRGELATLRAELAERDRKATEDKVLRDFNAKWEAQASVLRANGWRQAGIEAVQKFAEENGISDLSIAADAWQTRNPAPPPSTSSGGLFGLFGQKEDEKDTYIEDLMKVGGDDNGLLDQEIRRTLADVRATR